MNLDLSKIKKFLLRVCKAPTGSDLVEGIKIDRGWKKASENALKEVEDYIQQKNIEELWQRNHLRDERREDEGEE